MFGFLDSEEKRTRKEFAALYTTAIEDPDMEKRAQAAQSALDLMPKLDPWRISQVSKRKATGKLHAARGLAFGRMTPSDPAKYSKLSMEAYEQAGAYLTEEDGRDWGLLLQNWGAAYAEQPGNRTDNIERAIEMTKAATQAFLQIGDKRSWSRAQANLAGYYAERKAGDPDENHQQAISSMEAVFEAFDVREDPVQWAMMRSQLGTLYSESKRSSRLFDAEKAIELHEEALEHLNPHEQPGPWAMAQLALAKAHFNRVKGRGNDNVETALERNAQALERISLEADRVNWGVGHMDRARYYLERREGLASENQREAIRCCQTALEAFPLDRDPIRHAIAKGLLSSAQGTRIASGSREGFDAAIASAREALAALPSDASRYDRAVAESLLAGALLEGRGDDYRSRVEEAIQLLEASRDKLDAMSHPQELAAILDRLAGAYSDRLEGDPIENREQAIELHQQALAGIDERQNPEQAASIVYNLAISLSRRLVGQRADNVERQLAILERALLSMTEYDHPEQRANLLEMLADGYSHRVRGERVENLECARDCLTTARSEYAQDKTSEGWLRLDQKRLQVELMLQSAGSRSAKDGAEDGAASSRASESEVSAATFFEELEAQGKAVSREDHPRTWLDVQIGLADALSQFAPDKSARDLSDFLTAMKSNLRRAVDVYEDALSTISRETDIEYWTLLKKRLARTFSVLWLLESRPSTEQRTESADDHIEILDSAIRTTRGVLEVESPERSPKTYLETAVQLAKLLVWKKDWEAASETYLQAGEAADLVLAQVDVAPSEERDVLGSLVDLANQGPYALLALGRTEQAIALSERSRSRVLAKALALRTLPLSTEKRRELEGLQTALAEVEDQLVSPRLIDRSRPLSKSEQLRRDIRRIVEETGLETLQDSETAQALERLTSDGSVVVLPILTEAGGRVIFGLRRESALDVTVIESGGERELKEICGGRPLTKETSWTEKYLTRGGGSLKEQFWNQTLHSVGSELWKAFAGSVVEFLDQSEVAHGTRLHLLPQGPLGMLPLGLASAERGGAPLLERYPITLNPSLTSAAHSLDQASRCKSDEQLRLALLWGRFEKNSVHGPLPFAEVEAGLAASWFPADQSQVQSSEALDSASALERLLGGDVWHFSTHGKFRLDATLASGLILNDDHWLTLEELLRARNKAAPRLVTLAACETAVYDATQLPQEFIGLPTAFLQAGAIGVIGSLWSVPDISTTLLVGRLYEEWLGAGKDLPLALRTAQLWVRDSSVGEITSRLGRWRDEGRVDDQQAQAAMDEVIDMAGSASDSAVPFAAPNHWAGFVHYGA